MVVDSTTAVRLLDEITPSMSDRMIDRFTRLVNTFVADFADREGTRFLLTWVRADYDGAMIRALRDKGWTCTGFAEPSEASNREDKPIRKRWKWRFLCPVEQVTEQSTLETWT